ncbi:hypothetical protein ACTXT7_011625 [Hymenolepis weldensis]
MVGLATSIHFFQNPVKLHVPHDLNMEDLTERSSLELRDEIKTASLIQAILLPKKVDYVVP